jgi:ribosome-binding factor A
VVLVEKKTEKGRAVRLASAIQTEVADLLVRTVKDPRVVAAGLLTVTHVALNPDLRLGRVYVSFVGASEEAQTDALDALAKIAGWVRGEVGRRLNLRRAPELRFMRDESADQIAKIEALLATDPPPSTDGEDK